MDILSKFGGFFKNRTRSPTVIRLMNLHGDSFTWSGKIYQSDIVRACIRPKALEIGKTVPCHMREKKKPDGSVINIENPEMWMKMLLLEPNPLMGWQEFAEKMIMLLSLNGNSFAQIVRNSDGLPAEIYPLDVSGAEAVYPDGSLWIRFNLLTNGDILELPYRDIIHLRRDYCSDSVFGTPTAPAIASMMEVVANGDKSIVTAIKNSAVVKWLLKLATPAKDDRKKEIADTFASAFLSSEEGSGVAVVDPSSEAVQVKADNFVPEQDSVQGARDRIYSFFGVSEDIVQSKYTEETWAAYYQREITPDMIRLAGELTRKLFNRRERVFGNSIALKNDALEYLSIDSKIDLSNMVDRGALTPNEWRATLRMPPLDGGDKPIRRLDTAQVTLGGGDEK